MADHHEGETTRNPLGPAGGDVLRHLVALGTQALFEPLHLVLNLAEPIRPSLGRGLRRSFGLGDPPGPPSMDSRAAFFDPAGVARRVHSDLPSMVIGGLSALFLQTLHPLAMAGVAEHSNYRADAAGRLQRTAAFVGTTTFGSKEEVDRAIAEVKVIHERVKGIAPDGRPYSANDPELLTWIHTAEMSSFLAAAQRFGPRRLTPEECDAYFAETSKLALAIGANWAPRSSEEVTAYLLRMRPQLYAGPQALEARDFLLRGLSRRPEDRAVHAVTVAAAISILPAWARADLRLPNPPLLDRVAVVPAARLFCAGVRWAVSGPGGPTPPPNGRRGEGSPRRSRNETHREGTSSARSRSRADGARRQ